MSSIASVNLISGNQQNGDNFNSNWFYDWGALLKENTTYLVNTTFSTRFLTFSTNLDIPILYSNMFSGLTNNYTTYNANIQNYPQNLIGTPAPSTYSTLTTFNIETNNTIPLHISSRPKNNFFNIHFVKNTTNNTDFTIGSAEFDWILNIQFIEYKPLLNTTAITMPLPFNIFINSVNGNIINTKSYIEYDIALPYMNPNVKMIMKTILQTKAMNTTSSSPLLIYSNILNGSNNYSITSTNSASCDQVGVAIPTTYASLSGVNTGVDYNIGIETYLPKQGKFNIQFREMVNSSVLWTPSAGVMEDYVIILMFH
mgnify:FL=1